MFHIPHVVVVVNLCAMKSSSAVKEVGHGSAMRAARLFVIGLAAWGAVVRQIWCHRAISIGVIMLCAVFTTQALQKRK